MQCRLLYHCTTDVFSEEHLFKKEKKKKLNTIYITSITQKAQKNL